MSQLDWKLRKIYDETMLINIRINITKTVLLPGVNTTDTMFWFNFQGAYVTNFWYFNSCLIRIANTCYGQNIESISTAVAHQTLIQFWITLEKVLRLSGWESFQIVPPCFGREIAKNNSNPGFIVKFTILWCTFEILVHIEFLISINDSGETTWQIYVSVNTNCHETDCFGLHLYLMSQVEIWIIKMKFVNPHYTLAVRFWPRRITDCQILTQCDPVWSHCDQKWSNAVNS